MTQPKDLPPLPPVEVYDEGFTHIDKLFGDTFPMDKPKSPVVTLNQPKPSALEPSPPKRDSFNDDQSIVFEELKAGLNVFLTGEGGTGKSFVTEGFIEWLIENKKKFVICAPTGVAAINVSGVTMHRAFGLPIDYIENSFESGTKDAIREVIAASDVIIIDEVGMVRADQLNHIEYKLRKYANHGNPHATAEESWGGKQIVVVGDFFQLMPVVKDKVVTRYEDLVKSLYRHHGGIFAFESKSWHTANFKCHCLMKSERHKDGDNASEFMSALNKFRRGDASSIQFFNDNCTNKLLPDQQDTVITFTNARADDINRQRLATLMGKSEVIHDIPSGTVSPGDRLAPQALELKVGARVSMLVNRDSYVNGTIGEIQSIQLSAMPDDEDVIVVKEIGTEAIHFVKRFEWEVHEMEVVDGAPQKKKIGSIMQFPLRLAWAITAHKSQGKTLDKAIIMMDGNYRSHGQAYVALSRVKSSDGITLYKEITRRDLVCDNKVTHFYARMFGQRMTCDYDPSVHRLIAGINELSELSPPDGCLDWIMERISYAIAEMNERQFKPK